MQKGNSNEIKLPLYNHNNLEPQKPVVLIADPTIFISNSSISADIMSKQSDFIWLINYSQYNI
jgi:hypothetical protein